MSIYIFCRVVLVFQKQAQLESSDQLMHNRNYTVFVQEKDDEMGGTDCFKTC